MPDRSGRAEHMKSENICMHFSGIYEDQKFYKEADFTELSLQDLSGTNCYCDDPAMEAIRERIRAFSGHGIHFFDSGNYHYMSRIWLEKLQQPFCLVVFDHHTDMQLPAFGGILSCGGWIAASMEDLPFLKQVIVIGPDQASIDLVDPSFRDRATWFSQEKLEEQGTEGILKELTELNVSYPVYFSIDKDVLNESCLKANWSQGSMTTAELIRYLEAIQQRVLECGQQILGMDVCGESDIAHPECVEESDAINKELHRYWISIQ